MIDHPILLAKATMNLLGTQHRVLRLSPMWYYFLHGTKQTNRKYGIFLDAAHQILYHDEIIAPPVPHIESKNT